MVQKRVREAVEFVEGLMGGVDSWEGFPFATREAVLAHSTQSKGINIECLASTADLWRTSGMEPMPEFSFRANGEWLTVPENNAFLISSIAGGADGFQPATFQLCQFHSKTADWTKRSFLRSLQQIKRANWLRTFRTLWYCEGHMSSAGLLEIQFKDKGTFHLYPYKCGDRQYLVCDALFETTIKEFNELAFAAQTALGFFIDEVHLGDSFAVCYDSPDMEKPCGVYYQEFRDSIAGYYSVFTTNRHWLKDCIKLKECNNYALEQIDDPGRDPDMFSPLRMDFFSNMANELYEHEELRRAALMLIEGSTQALEYQTSLYSVALECLSGFHLKKKGEKPQSPTAADTFRTKVLPALESAINRSVAEGDIDAEAAKIYLKRLPGINNPPNQTKLTAPFGDYGYALTPTDKKAIEQRNRFLHGGILSAPDYGMLLDELRRCCIRLHKLCSILLLKQVGFDAWILNRPVLEAFREECDAHEPLMIKL